MTDITPDLELVEDMWGGIPTENQGYIPDGKYEAMIENVYTDRTHNGDACLKWKFDITSGQYKGNILWRTSLLKSEDNLRWLKKDLFTCGLIIHKIQDLPHKCSDLNGKNVEIQTKSDNEYTNIYINKKLKEKMEDIPF